MSDFAAALGRIPSGLFVLSAERGNIRHAMLASWVMQSSFEPPTLTVAVQSEREFAATILKPGSRAVLNILGEKNNSLISRFSKKPEGDDPFAGLELSDSVGYGPTLTEAHASLGCEVKDSVAAGDHRVFILEVKEGALQQEDSPKVHIRKNGLKY